ncbi:Na(+)-translocating NADH-quinone reductase subunit A [Marinilongibacter aquaticus]|uniref:Na(+)-translocating NADH-quinone reductase subunit A n=1 Tax=Marinilongibacter aquaticus TaxID=2975157 RepID=UPI0021BD500F|nr:Na(+)-translocating NADH-quinone reductase subunit A [Marinilongibacter aquaticus]UBM57955.1 Na(+)-translocating NADH-quinone reductase subunit A [Marinilongibacter aquaticus]
MSRTVLLKKGYDIKLIGEAAKEIQEVPYTEVFAVKPTDYLNLVPKLTVKVGDEVLVGDCLFHDKKNEEIRFPSPVSGEVVEIVRGAKRKVLEVRILADKDQREAQTVLPENLNREEVIATMLKGNMWSLIRQRPFNTVAKPEDKPKAVFISTFDSAPLAPNLSFVIQQDSEAFQKGLEIVNILADGALHIGLAADSNLNFSVGESTVYKGPHPAGNVGVQIHHTKALKPREKVWYIDVQDVILLGRFFQTGTYVPTRLVALTGSEAVNPSYLKMRIGQSLESVWGDQDGVRLIQGNVLTGSRSQKEDFLSFYTAQLSMIPEGHESEFLGWLLPSSKKLSVSRTFFSWLMPNKKYALNTNLHGEERAFVMSGQYEKVLPMNIMPVQLLKAILAKDVEKMEALGVHELAEEDLALCEFVCTSKIEVQRILREGLEILQEEG